MNELVDSVRVVRYISSKVATIAYAHVGEDYAKKAVGLIFSVELLESGEVILYGRRSELADTVEAYRIAQNNSASHISPLNMIKELIDELFLRQQLRSGRS